jgi:hypothetical protein
MTLNTSAFNTAITTDIYQQINELHPLKLDMAQKKSFPCAPTGTTEAGHCLLTTHIVCVIMHAYAA